MGPVGPPYRRRVRRSRFLNGLHSAFRDVAADLDDVADRAGCDRAGPDDVADRAGCDRAGPDDVADQACADGPADQGEAYVCREADQLVVGLGLVVRLGPSRLASSTCCSFGPAPGWCRPGPGTPPQVAPESSEVSSSLLLYQSEAAKSIPTPVWEPSYNNEQFGAEPLCPEGLILFASGLDGRLVDA